MHHNFAIIGLRGRLLGMTVLIKCLHPLECLSVLTDVHPGKCAQLREESRFDSGIDVKLDFEGSHSFVCCPLLTSTGECMGVIQLVKSGIGQVHITVYIGVCVVNMFQRIQPRPYTSAIPRNVPLSITTANALMLTRGHR